jgi:hypothetical protein
MLVLLVSYFVKDDFRLAISLQGLYYQLSMRKMNHFLTTMVNQPSSLQSEGTLDCTVLLVLEPFGLSIEK